jgi:hypothetical protein
MTETAGGDASRFLLVRPLEQLSYPVPRGTGSAFLGEAGYDLGDSCGGLGVGKGAGPG